MDALALASLLGERREHLVGLARRRLPTEADAEDVVQGAMMRAAAHAGALEDPARVGPWFGRILRRSIADFYRSRRPDAVSDSSELEALAEPVEPRHTPCPCALRLMHDLRPAYAEVLRLVDVEGRSVDEAAAGLQISPANAHVRLHRARHALRDHVALHCGVSSCGPCLDCSCDAHHRCGDDAPAGSE
jgi:RNA polymerase sigma-70 factor (ECF subfamily)